MQRSRRLLVFQCLLAALLAVWCVIEINRAVVARRYADVLRGSLVIAQRRNLPTVLIQWNIENKTPLRPSHTTRWTAFGGIEFSDMIQIKKCIRVANQSPYLFDHRRDSGTLAFLHNELFHAMYARLKGSELKWFRDLLKRQEQYPAKLRERMAEEAVSETIQNVFAYIESYGRVPRYTDLEATEKAPLHNDAKGIFRGCKNEANLPISRELFDATVHLLMYGPCVPTVSGQRTGHVRTSDQSISPRRYNLTVCFPTFRLAAIPGASAYSVRSSRFRMDVPDDQTVRQPIRVLHLRLGRVTTGIRRTTISSFVDSARRNRANRTCGTSLCRCILDACIRRNSLLHSALAAR